jgi:hypothetical protein
VQKIGMRREIVRQPHAETASWVAPRRRRLLLAGVIVVVLLICLLSVAIGSVFIPPPTTLKILLARLPFVRVDADWPSTFETILFDIRLPRVALIGLTGAALACSGTAYQGLFRNPLADPYLIGVASGAGLGAIGAIALQVAHPGLGALIVPTGAFAGALVTMRGGRRSAASREHPVEPRGGRMIAVCVERPGTERLAIEALRANNARDVGATQGDWRDGSWRDFDPRAPLATV